MSILDVGTTVLPYSPEWGTNGLDVTPNAAPVVPRSGVTAGTAEVCSLCSQAESTSVEGELVDEYLIHLTVMH